MFQEVRVNVSMMEFMMVVMTLIVLKVDIEITAEMDTNEKAVDSQTNF